MHLSPDVADVRRTLKTFARQARKRLRTENGGYRRDYLRALAQRVEVDAKELRNVLKVLVGPGGLEPPTWPL
jgi:hypothetical protein